MAARGRSHLKSIIMQTRPFASLCLLLFNCALSAAPIDRLALVTRHDVVLTNFDIANPLSVGNGEFCFTVDATGLQTFPEAFARTTPLGTLSDWGWHTFPNPEGWDIDHFQFKEFSDLNGRKVPYADVPNNRQTPEIKWLRDNPHRLHLGQIGFVLKRADGSLAAIPDLQDIQQKLDLWDGNLISHFKFDGASVDVETVCDPELDALAVRVVSPLVSQGRLAIQIHFPYGTGETSTADWSQPQAHETIWRQEPGNRAHFERRLDADRYVADAQWSAGADIKNTARHQFEISFALPPALPPGEKEKRSPQAGRPIAAGGMENPPPLSGGESQGEGKSSQLEFVCPFSPAK